MVVESVQPKAATTSGRNEWERHTQTAQQHRAEGGRLKPELAPEETPLRIPGTVLVCMDAGGYPPAVSSHYQRTRSAPTSASLRAQSPTQTGSSPAQERSAILASCVPNAGFALVQPYARVLRAISCSRIHHSRILAPRTTSPWRSLGKDHVSRVNYKLSWGHGHRSNPSGSGLDHVPPQLRLLSRPLWALAALREGGRYRATGSSWSTAHQHSRGSRPSVPVWMGRIAISAHMAVTQVSSPVAVK